MYDVIEGTVNDAGEKRINRPESVMGGSEASQHFSLDQEKERDVKIEDTGLCHSVSCRIWVSVGYFFIGCILALVYRMFQRPSVSFDEREDCEEDEEYSQNQNLMANR